MWSSEGSEDLFPKKIFSTSQRSPAPNENYIMKMLICDSGKTLLEYLIVLVISTIISSSAYFCYADLKNSAQRSKASKELASILRGAQQRAIAGTHDIELQIRSKSIQQLGTGATVYRLPKLVNFDTAIFGRVAADTNIFIARANGSVSPGRIVLRTPRENSCILTISLRGLIRNGC